MVFHKELQFKSDNRCEWVDITRGVKSALAQSGIASGICTICSLHTTAGITINENADPDVETDFFAQLERLAPVTMPMLHAEHNSDSHVKASLVGFSVQVPILKGALILGTWQSIYFCEFDGPRSRAVTVTVIGE